MIHEGVISRSEIRALAERVAREFQPERIILFGSYANGEPTLDSDVDLLVVLPHRGKAWRMAAEIRGRIRPRFPLDLLVRAPEEIHRRLAGGDPFLREIVEEGELLYEDSNA